MKHEVPLIPQTSTNSCWAAGIAMIVGWKKKMSIPDEIIARNAGGRSYMPSYQNELDPNDKNILKSNGFQIEAPKSYTIGLMRDLIKSKGPFWVATWAPGLRIRVVTGITVQGLFINDPWPVNKECIYSMPFTRFFGAMENLGSRGSLTNLFCLFGIFK